MVNCSKIPIPFTEKIFKRQLYLGAGVLSVMGTSFTFLVRIRLLIESFCRFCFCSTHATVLLCISQPIYQIAIGQMIANGIDPKVAYGKMVRTNMGFVRCFSLELLDTNLNYQTVLSCFR